MTTATIKIDPEFKALIPPLTDEERQQLEDNLIADGCRDALVVWDKGDILVDGHNRYEICTRLGIEYRVEEMVFDSREDVLDWIDANQLGRRNLTADAFRLLLGRRYNRAKKRQGTNNQYVQANEKDQNDTFHSTPAPESTANTLGKQYGVSPATVKRAGQYAKAVEKVSSAGISVANKPAGAVVKAAELLERSPEKASEILAGKKTLSDVRHEEKRAELERKIQQQTRETSTGKLTLIKANAFAHEIPPQSFDLLLTDPPYSTDVDDMDTFIAGWLPKALAGIKRTGRGYIFVGAYPAELRAYLNAIEDCRPEYLSMAQILPWSYRNTIGPSPTHHYKLNWQACLYLVGADAPRLDCPVMLEQFAAQEINAPDARTGVRYHSWQKPDQLAERIIRHSTKIGDTVLDLFAGTGTFPSAAVRLGRNCIAVEQSDDMLAICERRGLEVASVD